METRTYTVYKFSELSEEAQQNALENLYDINVDFDDWSEYVIEQWKEEVTAKGYSDIKVYYSGFSSQGDGACFESKIDLEKWMISHKVKTKFRNVWNSAIVQDMDYDLYTKHQGHYYHSGCMTLIAEAYGFPDKAYLEFHDLLTVEILEDARDCADDLYRRLEKEYDYQTSKEAVKETIDANDYDFLENGKLT